MKSFIPLVHRSSRVPFRLRRDISSELPSPLAAPRRSFTNSLFTIAEVNLHPKARRPYLVAFVRPWIIRQRCWIEPAELPLDLVAHARGAELPGSGKLQWASLLAHPFSRWPLSLVLSLGELPASLFAALKQLTSVTTTRRPPFPANYVIRPDRHERGTKGQLWELASCDWIFLEASELPLARTTSALATIGPVRGLGRHQLGLPQPHSSAASCLGLTNHADPLCESG